MLHTHSLFMMAFFQLQRRTLFVCYCLMLCHRQGTNLGRTMSKRHIPASLYIGCSRPQVMWCRNPQLPSSPHLCSQCLPACSRLHTKANLCYVHTQNHRDGCIQSRTRRINPLLLPRLCLKQAALLPSSHQTPSIYCFTHFRHSQSLLLCLRTALGTP